MKLEELSFRYSISLNALKNRIKILGGDPEVELTVDLLRKLDSLNSHLQAGGTASDFLKMEEPITPVALPPTGELRLVQSEGVRDADQFLAAEYAVALRTRLDLLQACCDNAWELPTSSIAQILGERPRNGWRRYGFTFTRNGSHGRESSWLVSR